MAKVGTFNRVEPERLPPRPEGRDHIDVDGSRVELKHVQDVPGYPMAEWCRLITTPTPSKDILTQSILQGVLEACFTDDGLATFRNASLTLLPVQIVDIAFALYGWWAAVPFEELPALSDGPTPTSGKPSESSDPTSPDSEPPESSAHKSPDQLRLEAIVSSGS